MSDLTRPPIRDLIAQLARIEDLRRVAPAHGTEGTSGAPSHAALSVAEQDIINELRRPGRPLRLLGLPTETNGHETYGQGRPVPQFQQGPVLPSVRLLH